jgi:multiple sugar transport system permease protein
MKMAGVVIVSIPLLIMFILFRKYIMRGVSRSGIKG